MPAGQLDLVRRREVNQESLFSPAERNSDFWLTGMFVRANDPTALLFADRYNRKVKQLHLGTLQLETVYSNTDPNWSLVNVAEVVQTTLLICEWNRSMFFLLISLIIKIGNSW